MSLLMSVLTFLGLVVAQVVICCFFWMAGFRKASEIAQDQLLLEKELAYKKGQLDEVTRCTQRARFTS